MRKLISGVAILAALTVTVTPASAENMSKEQITRQIIGKTLITSRKGMKVRLRYNTDGTVRLKAFVISGGGTWEYSDDGLCMNMTSGPKKGRTCVSFEHLGGNKYRNSEGAVLTAQE
jgi:hypothetical protein